MYNNRKAHPYIPALLVMLIVWLMAPALADGGDPGIASQAWPMIKNGALLIDVRTKEEFDAGHIKGALNIPFENTAALMSAIGADKQREVVLYCRNGHRSGKAKAALEAKGYTGTFNATGYGALKASKP